MVLGGWVGAQRKKGALLGAQGKWTDSLNASQRATLEDRMALVPPPNAHSVCSALVYPGKSFAPGKRGGSAQS